MFSVFVSVFALFSVVANASNRHSQEHYLELIGNKIGFSDVSLRAVSSAVDAILTEPRRWSRDTLRESLDWFVENGEKTNLSPHHSRFVIGEECASKHKNSKSLQLYCQVNKWLGNVKDDSMTFNEVMEMHAEVIEEVTIESANTLKRRNSSADQPEPKRRKFEDD